MSYLENEFFLLAITFGIYFFAKLLQKKTGFLLLNPILLTIAVLIVFLKMTHISYETYNKGGHLIEFWLKPAVVALGVPLYLQLETIKKQLLPILLSQLAGCFIGVVSVVLIAKLMGASQEVILSLAPDSRRSSLRRVARCYPRIQDNETDACRQPDSPRSLHGNGRSCSRNFHCYGYQQQIRSICQFGVNSQRHIYRIVNTDYSPIIGYVITKMTYICYIIIH